MALVVQVQQGEELRIGDAVLKLIYLPEKGRIKVWIDAPKSVAITRETAIKKVAG